MQSCATLRHSEYKAPCLHLITGYDDITAMILGLICFGPFDTFVVFTFNHVT